MCVDNIVFPIWKFLLWKKLIKKLSQNYKEIERTFKVKIKFYDLKKNAYYEDIFSKKFLLKYENMGSNRD